MQWVHDNYHKSEHTVPMRDGTKLHTIIYTPADTLPHPVLLSRCTYGCGPYGDRYDPDLWNLLSPFTERGYIIVKQDVRGLRMSEGSFENVRPATILSDSGSNELTDTYDTADWIIANTRNNGCIGVSGHSYLGFTSLLAGMSGHPAIKAICPQAPIGDWFMGDDFHHNGVFMPSHSFGFLSGFGMPRHSLSTKGHKKLKYYTDDEYSFYLRNRAIRDLTKLFGDSVVFWNDMMSHPDYDKFWTDRNPLHHIDTIQPAVLIVGGWYDAEDLHGTLAAHRAISSHSPYTPCHIIMGPWAHGSWRRNFKGLGPVRFGVENSTLNFKKMQLAFFEYYLRGIGSPIPDGATCFSSGDNRWHKFDQWPPVNSTRLNLYINDNAMLTVTKPDASTSSTTYTSNPSNPVPYTTGKGDYMAEDQRFASQRPDVVSFVTSPLDSAITVTGTVIPNIWMSSTTTDADIVVKLIDIYPDDFSYPVSFNPDKKSMGGYQQLVRGDIMAAHYRESFARRTPLTPEEPALITVPMSDVCHTFLPGHRIMIQIQSSWFPLFRMSPQQCIDEYTCGNNDFLPADITIYHNSFHPSSISLPVLSIK